ncbi:branched-chain amino acid ABC transporter permease [Streptomyces sp. NPDC004227]
MVDLLAAGIALGSIYVLAGLGFVLVHNATGAVNFAHGDLVVLGGMTAAALVSTLGVSPILVAVCVPILMFPLGLALETFAFRPLRTKNFSAAFTISIAISVIVSNVLLLTLGPEARTLAPLKEGRLQIGSFGVPWQSVLIVLLTVVMVAFQWWLFQRTVLGFKLRAAAQDPETARLMGIPVNRMTSVTVGVAVTYAGIAGVLLAPVVLLSSGSGSSLILKLYVAVVIGGFGSAIGAVIGGLSLGLLEVFTASYVSSSYVNAIIFALLFAVLLARPQGILGRTEVRV